MLIFFIMKTKTFGLVALLAIGCLAIAGCNKTENPDEKNVGMANPASVYCEEQ
jgi:putative hemolysin